MAAKEIRHGVKAITDFWNKHRSGGRSDKNRLYIVFDGWFSDKKPAIAVTYADSNRVRLWLIDFEKDQLIELDPQDFVSRFNGEELEKINLKGKRCQMCKGTGKVLAGMQPCPICKGAGKIDSTKNQSSEKTTIGSERNSSKSKPENASVSTTADKGGNTSIRSSLLFNSSKPKNS